MKKLLSFLVALLPLIASAQSGKSAVKLKNGTVLKGIIKHIDPTDALTLDIAGVETQIKMSDIAEVEALRDDSVEEDTPQQTIVQRRATVGDPLKDFKGFLLAKGNNVYVYSEDGELGKAGADELKKLLMSDGFWNVVDFMNEAHFTINYYVNLRHRDRVTIAVSSWRSNSAKVVYTQTSNGLETIPVNKELARNGYYDGIKSLQKKIEKMNENAPSGEFKKFVVK
jgi:hypothetical protein